MPLGAKYRLVDTYAKLLRAIAEIKTARYGVIAIDTEAAWWRMGAAHEKMSLIQIAADIDNVTIVYLIDCLAKLDLIALAPILENDSLIKVAHNAQYDVRKLAEHHGLQMKNVWCTLLAERRAGSKKNNKLADLSLRYFNTRLDKTEQTEEWGYRPLTQKQLVYAATDAVITLRIYHQQKAKGMNGAYARPGQEQLRTVLIPEKQKYTLPGFDQAFEIDRLYSWLKTFISSGNAKQFPVPFYDRQGVWVDDCEDYAWNLYNWLAKIFGDRKETVEEVESKMNAECCVPWPTKETAFQYLTEFYLFVQEGHVFDEQKVFMERYQRERAANRFRMICLDHEIVHERIHQRMFEEFVKQQMAAKAAMGNVEAEDFVLVN